MTTLTVHYWKVLVMHNNIFRMTCPLRFRSAKKYETILSHPTSESLQARARPFSVILKERGENYGIENQKQLREVNRD